MEALLRDALSAVAVSAFARRIDLAMHIDNRLPLRARGHGATVAAFLRRGLARMIEAGRVDKIVLALWLDEGAGNGAPRIVLEAGRTTGAAGAHAVPLANLWRMPVGEGTAEPRQHRRDAAAETVLVPLPCVPEPGTPTVGEKWREALAGRSIIYACDVVCDLDRLRGSFEALGFDADFTTDPDVALARARARAAAGKPPDFLLIDAQPQGTATIGLARRFRADPRLAGTAIVLSGSHRAADFSDEDAALFDARPAISMPWRRLFDVFRELVQARGGSDAPSPAPRRRAAGVPSLAGRRVLIAEDVATNQVLLRALLEATGAAIEAVLAGDEVLRRHKEEPADLIIMDLQMPRMGGLAAAERIRALEGAAGRVPILALTAHAAEADRQRALAAGMDAFLAKPIMVCEFYDLVERLLAVAPGVR